MADQSHDPPGASGALPRWWANVPKPLQHGTGEYQPPGYPTTTSFGVPTRFVPGPLNSGRLNQALDELQAQIGETDGIEHALLDDFAEDTNPSDGIDWGSVDAMQANATPVFN